MCLGIQLIVISLHPEAACRHGIKNSLAETTQGDEGRREEFRARVKDDEAALKQTWDGGKKEAPAEAAGVVAAWVLLTCVRELLPFSSCRGNRKS